MQRRHFELIASTIAGLEMTEAEKAKVIEAFCHALRGTNANFDRERFAAACKK